MLKSSGNSVLSIVLLLDSDFFIKAHPVDIIKWNLRGKDHVYLRIQVTFSVSSIYYTEYFKGCCTRQFSLNHDHS